MRILRSLIAPALLLLGLVLAGGCGANEVTVTDSDGHKTTIDKKDGGVTVKGDDGSNFTTGGDLPKDFPKDDVPLIEGTVAASFSGSAAGAQDGDKGWSVSIKGSKAMKDCYADASGKLTAKGFQKQGESTVATSTSAQFTGPKYNVNLAVSAISAEGCLATYLVGPVSK